MAAKEDIAKPEHASRDIAALKQTIAMAQVDYT